MKSTLRHNELIRLLRRRESTTVAALADSLAVSRRTLLRDITHLRDQGYLIHTSAGPGGGVYLDPSSLLLSPKLTSTEAFALLISVEVLRQTHSLPFACLADAGLRKIEQSLPREQALALRKILTNVYIGSAASSNLLQTVKEIDNTVLAVFENCFLQQKTMHFNYIDRHMNKTRRRADPHAMLVLTPVWYMVGYDPDKSAFRHFRMDRIADAQILDHTFRRQTFTLNEGAACPFSVFSWDAQDQAADVFD